MSTLENKFILNTYQGVLHSDGELTTEKTDIYDGKGNKSSLSIGKEGAGAEISGELTVGTVVYPDTTGNIGDFLYQRTATDLGFTSTIALSNLPVLSPSTEDTYTNIQSITVNSNGLITDVVEGDASIPIVRAVCATTNNSTTPQFTVNSGFTSVVRTARGKYLFTLTTGASSNYYVVQATASEDAVSSYNISCLVHRLSPTTFQVVCGFEDGDDAKIDSDVMVTVIF